MRYLVENKLRKPFVKMVEEGDFESIRIIVASLWENHDLVDCCVGYGAWRADGEPSTARLWVSYRIRAPLITREDAIGRIRKSCTPLDSEYIREMVNGIFDQFEEEK